MKKPAIPKILQRETKQSGDDTIAEAQEVCQRCMFSCKAARVAKDKKGRIKIYPRLVTCPNRLEEDG